MLVEKICHLAKIEKEIRCLFEKMEGMCHVEKIVSHEIMFSEVVSAYF